VCDPLLLSSGNVSVDMSAPARVVRDLLVRRWGLRQPNHYSLLYTGLELDLDLSLANQGILEQEHLTLHRREGVIMTPTTTEPTTELRRGSMIPESEDVSVWDEGPDSDCNIRYNTLKPGTVAGASFNKLVERVTSERDHG